MIFCARNNARLVVSRQAHRLGFIEFRILERRQLNEPVRKPGESASLAM